MLTPETINPVVMSIDHAASILPGQFDGVSQARSYTEVSKPTGLQLLATMHISLLEREELPQRYHLRPDSSARPIDVLLAGYEMVVFLLAALSTVHTWLVIFGLQGVSI